MALVLLTGAEQVLAHDRGGFPAQVKGLVTAVNATSNGNIQIQTSSASVTLGLTSDTHIIRSVSGSLVDVGVNDRIDAHLAQGTNTIRSIRVDETTKPKTRLDKHDQTPVPNRTPTHSKPPRQAVRPPTGEVVGQVVSINSSTITIRGQHGQTFTYTLSKSVIVTKLMNGNFANLAIGEMVVAQRTQSGNAVTITIMNA